MRTQFFKIYIFVFAEVYIFGLKIYIGALRTSRRAEGYISSIYAHIYRVYIYRKAAFLYILVIVLIIET